MYTEDYEELLQAASKLDERTEEDWHSIVGDGEYQTLSRFFSRDNYFDAWEETDRPAEETERLQKRVLLGQDRMRLIDYAFMLGRIVGRAHHILEVET